MLQRAAAAVWLVLLACGLAACRPTPQQAAEAGGRTRSASRCSRARRSPRASSTTWIKDELFREQTDNLAAASLYELRSSSLQDLLDERIVDAEAEKQGVSTDELLKRERAALGPISDEQVTDFYEKNKQRMGGATRDQVADRIRTFLDGQRDGEVKAALRKRANVEVLLEPPRITVAAEGPSLGPAGAPVTIVEFSDFQCPYCARAGAHREADPAALSDARSASSTAISRSSASTRTPAAPPRRRPAPTRRAASGISTTSSSPTSARWAPKISSATRRSWGSTRAAFAQCVKERKFQAQVDRDLAAAAEAADRSRQARTRHAVLLRERDPALGRQAARGVLPPDRRRAGARGLAGSGARLPPSRLRGRARGRLDAQGLVRWTSLACGSLRARQEPRLLDRLDPGEQRVAVGGHRARGCRPRG